MTKGLYAVGRQRFPEIAYLILGYIGTYAEGIHGYRLGRMLSRSPLGIPSLRLGQLYRILDRLEHHGLLEKRLELGCSRPARFIFTMTVTGASIFSRWLASPPRGQAAVRDQLLDRLRFADRLPASTLTRLLNEAVREWETEVAELRLARESVEHPPVRGNGLLCQALEKRLAADRSWLTELRRFADDAASATSGGKKKSAAALR